MAIVIAQPRYFFGIRTGITGNVLFQDEHTIVYPSGSNCVVYNIDQKTQKSVPCSDKSRGMSAIAISANKRFLAVAERGNLDKGEKPLIIIYDLGILRKRKILGSVEVHSDEFVSLIFSHDSKYLAGQGGAPDYTMSVWMWEKSKVIGNIKLNSPVVQVSFNPEDQTHVCAVGAGVCKHFRYSEATFKQFAFQKTEPLNYTCHSWANPEQVLVGSESGKIQLMEAGEVKQEFVVTTFVNTGGSESRSRSMGEEKKSSG